MKFLKNDAAEVTGIVAVIIMVALAIVIYSILGPGLVAPGLTSMSNTSAITGYSTWSTGTQNMWTSTPTLTGLAWLFIPIILIMAALKYI